MAAVVIVMIISATTAITATAAVSTSPSSNFIWLVLEESIPDFAEEATEDQRGSLSCLGHTAVSPEMGLPVGLLLLGSPLPLPLAHTPTHLSAHTPLRPWGTGMSYWASVEA